MDRRMRAAAGRVHSYSGAKARRAFFAPLRNWHRPVGNRLYLGLLQHHDETGDRRRIARGAEALSTTSALPPNAVSDGPIRAVCPAFSPATTPPRKF